MEGEARTLLPPVCDDKASVVLNASRVAGVTPDSTLSAVAVLLTLDLKAAVNVTHAVRHSDDPKCMHASKISLKIQVSSRLWGGRKWPVEKLSCVVWWAGELAAQAPWQGAL